MTVCETIFFRDQNFYFLLFFARLTFLLGSPDKLVLPFYRTPPYLTAKPQIRYHRLGVQDRALVIAR